MKEGKRPPVKNKLFAQLLHTLVPAQAPFVSVADAAQCKEAIFLDAREEGEYAVSHIHTAIHVGYKKFSLTALNNVPKNQKIIVYCSVGWRSAHIAQQLMAAGFTQVYNLYGGIFEWANLSQPLYQQHTVTNALHVYSKAWGVWVAKTYTKIC